MTVIGSAYVNIRAITTELERDIRRTIESITDTITLKVNADVTAATAKIEELSSSASDQTINVTANTAEAQTRLDALANDALGDQNITVNANTLPARSEFDNMHDDMDGNDVHVPVNLDDSVARVRLALLTRLRFARVQVIANSAPIVKLGNALSRLSGMRVATEEAKKLVHEFANIDEAVPKISKMSTIFSTLAGVIMSSLGGLLTLGASLGSILGMAATLAPGMIAGFAVGMGTLMVALKDFGKQLPDVVAKYKTLGATIKENFWDVAKEPLADMANTLFPAFQRGLAKTSTALGGWTAALADALKTNLDRGVLDNMFGSLAKSIDIAKGALAPLVGAFTELGAIGGSYLPKLAQWFVDISTKFGDFIALASDQGRITGWIDNGIIQLKKLGSLIGEISGFLGGLTEAAKNAGSDGLQTLLDVFTRLNDAVNSPEGIKSLTQIFQGANAVTGTLGDAVMDIFGALSSAAPAIKSAFESTAATVGFLGDAITSIISNPEFQAGFAAMFGGIAEGASKLLPILGQTGPKLGALLSIVGNLASNLGGILGKALEVTLPLITAFKQAIDPLIPILGDALVRIIGALGPLFQTLADTITVVGPPIAEIVKFVAELVAGIVEGIGPALPMIAILAGTFVGVLKVMSIVSTVIGVLSSAFSTITAVVSGFRWVMMALNIVFMANPIAITIAAIVALAAAFVYAYNNVGWFKDGVDAAVKWIGEAWNNMCKWIGEAFNNTVQFITDAWNNTSGMFTDFFNNTVGMFTDFFNNTVGMFSDWINGIVGMAGDIGTGISDAFNGVVSFFTDVFNTIGSILAQGLDNFITNWTNIFNLVRDIFVNIWNGLVAVFSPIINLFVTIISAFGEIIWTIWSSLWEIVFTIFQGIWINLVSFFTPILQGISDFITTTVNAIVIVWNTAWQMINDFFTGIWNGIVAFVTPIIQMIIDTITNAVNGIVAVWNAVWQAIGDFFLMIWNNMVAFYTPIIMGIWNFIVAVGAGIAAAWNAIWTGISNVFSAIWNGIVGFVNGAINAVSNVIRGVIAGISAVWNATWSAISGFVSSVWSGIVGAVSGFVNTVRTHVTNVLTTIGQIGSNILNSIGNFPSLLISAGTDLINGLISGINSAKDAVVGTIKNIAAGALDAIKNFFGIKSPSRVMRDQVGKQLGAGLAIGIEQSATRVAKAASKLAEAAMPNMDDITLPTITPSKMSPLSANNGSQPVLTSSSIYKNRQVNQQTDQFGAPTGSGANVNLVINPSQGLSEQQIGEAAMKELYWQLSSR